jgi:hypothetical protein
MKWLISLVVVAFAGLAVSGVASSQSYRHVYRSISASAASSGDYTATETVIKVRGTSASNGTYAPKRTVTRTKTRSSAASSGTYGSVQRTVKRTSYGSSGK